MPLVLRLRRAGLWLRLNRPGLVLRLVRPGLVMRLSGSAPVILPEAIVAASGAMAAEALRVQIPTLLEAAVGTVVADAVEVDLGGVSVEAAAGTMQAAALAGTAGASLGAAAGTAAAGALVAGIPLAPSAGSMVAAELAAGPVEAPTITYPAEGAAFALSAVFMMQGSARAGATVRAYRVSDTSLQGTATADGAGAWSIACVMPSTGTSETFQAEQEISGITSPRASVTVSVDTTQLGTPVSGVSFTRVIGRKAGYAVSTPQYVASLGYSWRDDPYFGWVPDPQNSSEWNALYQQCKAFVGNASSGLASKYTQHPWTRYLVPTYFIAAKGSHDPAAITSPADPANPANYNTYDTGHCTPNMAALLMMLGTPEAGFQFHNGPLEYVLTKMTATEWNAEYPVLEAFLTHLDKHPTTKAICVPSGVVGPYSDNGWWDSVPAVISGQTLAARLPSFSVTVLYARTLQVMRARASELGDTTRFNALDALLTEAIGAIASFKHRPDGTWDGAQWVGGTWDGWYISYGSDFKDSAYAAGSPMNRVRNFRSTNDVLAYGLASEADLAVVRAAHQPAFSGRTVHRGNCRVWVYPDLPWTADEGPNGYVDSGYWPGDQQRAAAAALNSYNGTAAADFATAVSEEILRQQRVGCAPWEYLTDPTDPNVGGVVPTWVGDPSRTGYHGALYNKLADLGSWVTEALPETVTVNLDGALGTKATQACVAQGFMGMTVTAPAPVTATVGLYARQRLNFDGDTAYTPGTVEGVVVDDFSVDVMHPKYTSGGTTSGAYGTDAPTIANGWTIASGYLTANSFSTSRAIRRDVSPFAAGYIEAKIRVTASANAPALIFRWVSDTDYMRLRFTSTGLRVEHVSTLVGTELTFARALSTWYKIKAVFNAGTVDVYVDDTLLGSRTVTHLDAGLCGMLGVGHFDDFTVSSGGASPPSVPYFGKNFTPWALLGSVSLAGETTKASTPASWTPANVYGGEFKVEVTGGGAAGVQLTAALSQPAHPSVQLVEGGTATRQPVPPRCTLEETRSGGKVYLTGEDYSAAYGPCVVRASDLTILASADFGASGVAIRYQ